MSFSFMQWYEGNSAIPTIVSRSAISALSSPQILFSPGLNELLYRVEEISKRKGISMAQVAAAWVMSRPGVTAPIVGSTNLDNLKDLLGMWIMKHSIRIRRGLFATHSQVPSMLNLPKTRLSSSKSRTSPFRWLVSSRVASLVKGVTPLCATYTACKFSANDALSDEVLLSRHTPSHVPRQLASRLPTRVRER